MTADASAPGIVIRFAETTEDREQVFRLRYQTYVAELPGYSAVADRAAQRLTDVHDEHSELLNAYADGELVGTLRLTFGADSRFSDEFMETYGLGAFSRAVRPEGMLVVARLVVHKAHRGTATPLPPRPTRLTVLLASAGKPAGCW